MTDLNTGHSLNDVTDILGKHRLRELNQMAGGLGFEPRLAESESAVLPLDDPPPAGVMAQPQPPHMRRL